MVQDGILLDIEWQYNLNVHHFFPDSPKVGERVSQGGRDGEGAEEKVGEGQVDQEDVSRGPHYLQFHINQMLLELGKNNMNSNFP